MMGGSQEIQVSEKRTITRRRTSSWESESPKALVFDPDHPDNVTEEAATAENKASNSLEVQLPRWRNRVHIYEDQAKEGYIFTLRLDRLGFRKNCKRRLGYDYKVLHVKGEKPIRSC
ncbi:hypothetical protein IMSHALPRED_008377 [Imshaugia aleurites]|uniref:Uncharacterized protein n=1 Tax=Imshaugia aleurites TaxID=172621 RepID=A0A8H3EV73_9LECA|nr:hypothetical protein IMSHALPRED_008377 [Imshaugia aleurites]